MSESNRAQPSNGPDAALAELGRAITRAADALAEVAGADDATAYRCARALDTAFSDLDELLRTVPGIVELGDPGTVVSKRLAERQAELAARRAEVAVSRAKLDDLAASERRLADVTAEADQLNERIGGLDRAQRLAPEIPQLRMRANALQESVAAAGVADSAEIGERIADAVGQLAAITDRQREAIGAAADSLVERAETTAKELAEQQTRRDAAAADLAKRQSDAAQLAAEHREMLPVLAAWSKADADLANGLRMAGFPANESALQSVDAELDSIRKRLADVDSSLRSLLADHAKAVEDTLRIRPL
jgi:hypothetical protein